ncbi:ribulose 1,5-bisphosphate carboxylase, partial [candidate division MSBL1 archaeon SCGC-AAA259M10]
MVSIEYEDFLDLEYKPNETDLICEFYVEPAKDMSMEDAAGRVASESSNGTWSGLEVDERIREMSATTFSIEDNIIRI